MIELDFSIETLANARAFLQLEMRSQWIYRLLLARLYYAAHHLPRLLLRSVGLAPEQWRRDVHHRVWSELRQHYVNIGRMNIRTLNILERLRRRRIRADYELHFVIRDEYMDEAVVLFADYLNACQQILGVT
ncbi:TPA: hypothetical protein EYP66_11920 [Candidatus Poribacteria bacterium]|nr:hypothetical protein [Candidatus Poribacteria bacterium]